MGETHEDQIQLSSEHVEQGWNVHAQGAPEGFDSP